jgi:chemotaxis protein methyltransferase CheR
MAQHLAPSSAGVAGLFLRRDELPDIELQLLLDALLRYGSCDFRVFNQSVLRRKVADAMRAENVNTISGLIDRLLHDERSFATFVTSIKAPAAQPFYDPGFYRSFSANVIPLLRTYSFVRIWVPTAGPSASAYALASLLAEARLIEKTIIYATFINDPSVASVKTGLRHGGRDQMEANARASGLGAPVSRYFEIDDEFAVPRSIIRDSVMLARHNPASDASINEFHAIVARGFAPLLNGSVQYRLHALMYESLTHLGFLALGGGENIAHTPHEISFRQVAADQPIYRRLR